MDARAHAIKLQVGLSSLGKRVYLTFATVDLNPIGYLSALLGYAKQARCAGSDEVIAIAAEELYARSKSSQTQ